jgi:hypothetical protein
MTQATPNRTPVAHAAAAPAGFLRTLPWIFVCLGVLAPLALVAFAAWGSEVSAVRAQMIVQGSELLAGALLCTVVLSLLYALGAHEAALVTAPERRALPQISVV